MTDLPLLDSNSFLATDMSPFVVHFTRDAYPHSAYEVCKIILDQKVLKAKNAFGTGKEYAPCPKSVCFSEAKLTELKRVCKKRSKLGYGYGLGFHKEFIVAKGGGPILYAYKDTPHSKVFRELVEAAQSNINDPIWKLAPFVDRPGWYQGILRDRKYFFEWEREWRHVGDLTFLETDLSFVILPENEHANLRSYLSDVSRCENLPRYQSVPFVCLEWEDSKIKESLKAYNVKNWYCSV